MLAYTKQLIFDSLSEQKDHLPFRCNSPECFAPRLQTHHPNRTLRKQRKK